MTIHLNRRTGFALAALLLVGSISALAQAPSNPAPTGAPGHHMQHRDPAKMQAMMEKRQAELKAKLTITPAQESAWSAFTAAMKPPADWNPAARQAQRAELDKLPTPERIDKMRALRAERMSKMNAEMDKRGNAAKALYAALTPTQQKVFDAEHQKHGARGEHGKRGGHRM